MSRILRAAGAAALTLVLFVPASASAEHWSATDDARDVHGGLYDPEPAPCGTFTELDSTAETNTDITDLVVRHTRRSVLVAVRFRDLKSRKDQFASLYLRTPNGSWWLDVERFHQGGRARTDTFLAEEPEYPDDTGECGEIGYDSIEVSCRVAERVSVADDVMQVAIPRKCLHNPRWLRVGVDSNGGVQGDPDHPIYALLSDEWAGGTVLTPWQISYGPRIRAVDGK